jgi:hypothetical protein
VKLSRKASFVKKVTNLPIEREVGQNILDSPGFSKTAKWTGVDVVVCIFGTEMYPNQSKNTGNKGKNLI